MVKKLMTISLTIAATIWLGCLILLLTLDSNQLASDTIIIESKDLEPDDRKLETENTGVLLQSCPPAAPAPPPPPVPLVVKRIDDGHLHASKVVKR